MKEIPIIINNKEYIVRANSTILQACESSGLILSKFCYHEKLSIAGNCRMCLVELQKSPKPVAACAMPVVKDMVIFTDSPLVQKARENVFNHILINHPLDCPICDQGSECDLQDETLHFGSDRGRYKEWKRSTEDKKLGPVVEAIMTRCIHCTRCVRFTTEICGHEILGAFNRGEDMEIGTYVQLFLKTELSGNLVDICPVGALTSKPYAFVARNWELKNVESVDFFDGICSDIIVNVGKSKIKRNLQLERRIESKDLIVRILPNTKSIFEENWISDRTRYGYEGFYLSRLVEIIQKKKNKTTTSLNWKQNIEYLNKILKFNFFNNIDFFEKKIVVSFGSLLDLETIFTISWFSKFCGNSDFVYENKIMNSNADLSSFFMLNNNLNSLKDLKNLIIVGVNPRFEASLYNTYLRKYQQKYNLLFVSFFAFNSLGFSHLHNGNSMLDVLSFCWNKKKNLKILLKKNSSIVGSFNSISKKNGFLIQNINRLLGKKLLVKNKQGERLGFLHSNIGSLNLLSLGLNLNVRSLKYNNENYKDSCDVFFKVQNQQKNNIDKFRFKNAISFTTQKSFSDLCDLYIPIKNLYEKNFLTYNVENKLCKGYKSIGLESSNLRSVENFLISLLLINKASIKEILNSFWLFSKKIPVNNIINKSITNFNINYFSFLEENYYSNTILFFVSILNFYQNDSVSENSKTLGYCATFLQNTSILHLE